MNSVHLFITNLMHLLNFLIKHAYILSYILINLDFDTTVNYNKNEQFHKVIWLVVIAIRNSKLQKCQSFPTPGVTSTLRLLSDKSVKVFLPLE